MVLLVCRPFEKVETGIRHLADPDPIIRNVSNPKNFKVSQQNVKKAKYKNS